MGKVAELLIRVKTDAKGAAKDFEQFFALAKNESRATATAILQTQRQALQFATQQERLKTQEARTQKEVERARLTAAQASRTEQQATAAAGKESDRTATKQKKAANEVAREQQKAAKAQEKAANDATKAQQQATRAAVTAAAEQKRVRDDLARHEFSTSQRSSSDYKAYVTRRLDEEKEFTRGWLSLLKERQRAEQAEERDRRRPSALANAVLTSRYALPGTNGAIMPLVGRTGQAFGMSGNQATVAAVAVAGAAAIGRAAVNAAVSTASFIDKATDKASDLTEAINKSDVVFGQSSASIQKWAEGAVDSMGLTEQAAIDAAGGFGALFKSIHVAENQSASMSKSLSQRAADITSLYNAVEGTEGVLRDMRSGLVGEPEPLRKFGIFISEARVQVEAYNMGLGRLSKGSKEAAAANAKITIAQRAVDVAAARAALAVKKYGDGSIEATTAQNTLQSAELRLSKAMDGHVKKLTDQEKVRARYNIILKDSAVAEGDFVRTSGEAANAQRKLNAQLEQAETEFGKAFLPLKKEGLGVLIELARFATDAAKAVRDLVLDVQNADKQDFGMGPGIKRLMDNIKALREILHTNNEVSEWEHSDDGQRSALHGDLGQIRSARTTDSNNRKNGTQNLVLTDDLRSVIAKYGYDPYKPMGGSEFNGVLDNIEQTILAKLKPLEEAQNRAVSDEFSRRIKEGAAKLPSNQPGNAALSDTLGKVIAHDAGVRASCAAFVSKSLEAAGIEAKRTNIAGELVGDLARRGAQRLPLSEARRGDVVVYHGKGYGAIKDGDGNGYHVGLALSGTTFRDSRGNQTRDKAIYRPGSGAEGYVLRVPAQWAGSGGSAGTGGTGSGSGSGTNLYSGAQRNADAKKAKADADREAKKREKERIDQVWKAAIADAGAGQDAAKAAFGGSLKQTGLAFEEDTIASRATAASTLSKMQYLSDVRMAQMRNAGDPAGELRARQAAQIAYTARQTQIMDAVTEAYQRRQKAAEALAEQEENARKLIGAAQMDSLQVQEETLRKAYDTALAAGHLADAQEQVKAIQQNLLDQAYAKAKDAASAATPMLTGGPLNPAFGIGLAQLVPIKQKLDSDLSGAAEEARNLNAAITEAHHAMLGGTAQEKGSESSSTRSIANQRRDEGIREGIGELSGRTRDISRGALFSAFSGNGSGKELAASLGQAVADSASTGLQRALLDSPIDRFFNQMGEKLAAGLAAGGASAQQSIMEGASAIAAAAGILTGGSAKKKKNGLFGSILGAVVGSLIPGVGWLAGLGIGGNLATGNYVGAALGVAGTSFFGSGGALNLAKGAGGGTAKAGGSLTNFKKFARGGMPTVGRAAVFGDPDWSNWELSLSRSRVSMLGHGIRIPTAPEVVLPHGTSQALVAAAASMGGGSGSPAASLAPVTYIGQKIGTQVVRSREDAIEVAREATDNHRRRALME